MSKRCFNCKKKLGVMEFECKCKNKYCMTCLQPEKHNCIYDYKTEGIASLKKKLEKVAGTKIIAI
jgi:hypothetical protein